MKIIIGGCGEVGTALAEFFSEKNHDVTIIDSDKKVLDSLKQSFDLMTIEGDMGHPKYLKRAGINNCDIFIAVSISTKINVLSCSIAKNFNPNVKTICKSIVLDYFDEKDDYKKFGIDHLINAQKEYSSNILDVLISDIIKEKINLFDDKFFLVNCQLMPGSQAIGQKIQDLPLHLLEYIRVNAVVREGETFFPSGDYIFNNYDEIYISGTKEGIDRFVDYISFEKRSLNSILFVGITPLTIYLSNFFDDNGFDVKVIEPDHEIIDKQQERFNETVLILQSKIDDRTINDEIDLKKVDAAVVNLSKGEDNVLVSLIFKKRGVRKVISILKNSLYKEATYLVKNIDLFFSPLIATVNAIINSAYCGQELGLLQRSEAQLIQREVKKSSKICNSYLNTLNVAGYGIFLIAYRAKDVVLLKGDVLFKEGDKVLFLSKKETLNHFEKLF